VLWAPLRNVEVTATLSYDTRASNRPLTDYNVTTFFCPRSCVLAITGRRVAFGRLRLILRGSAGIEHSGNPLPGNRVRRMRGVVD